MNTARPQLFACAELVPGYANGYMYIYFGNDIIFWCIRRYNCIWYWHAHKSIILTIQKHNMHRIVPYRKKNMHCFDATPVLLIHCHIIYRANNSCSQGSQIWWHASPALHVCFLNQPNHCETIDRRSCKIYRILSVQSVWSDNPCIIHTTQTMYGELIAINDNLCLQWRAGTKAPLSTLNIDRQMCSRLARWYNCILLERAHCVQFINVMRAT